MDKKSRFSICVFLLMIPLHTLHTQELPLAPEHPEPDARFKSDILLIVAHPDDETAIGSFLAKMVYDEERTVSVIYTNRGNSGGNSIGNEQGMALGTVREVEVHRALAEFGIFNVWILDGWDTAGQDVFQSLSLLPHGSALEKTIRIIRLTRPEVIITWLPHYVSGENHGDHQASGVIATEAFDLAGDPTVFPVQVTVPRDRLDIGNYNEGLQPWQPKKLYFFSDREEPLEAPGPAFDITEVSTNQKVPFYELAARLHIEHQVQGDVAEVAAAAMASGDYSTFRQWLSRYNLIFGKALVPCEAGGGLFDGIQSGPIGYVRSAGYRKLIKSGVHFELGGAFAFYRDFWSVHNIEHLAGLVEPEVTVTAGGYLHIPLLLSNYTTQMADMEVQADLPEGWEAYSGPARYRLDPGKTRPVQALLKSPYKEEKAVFIITWTASVNEKVIGIIPMEVTLLDWALPQ